MLATTGPASSRKTRLTPEREAELYGKILELLQAEWYENLTMDTIASHTRSSKATLYRQWQSKPRLVAATLRHVKQANLATIDTGSICGDLREMARRYGHSGQDTTNIFWSIADSIRRNPELREALHEALIEPARQELNVILQRAIDRGEIRSDVPSFDFVHCTMMGAALSHSVTEGHEADSDFLIRYVDAVLLPALGVIDPETGAAPGADSRP